MNHSALKRLLTCSPYFSRLYEQLQDSEKRSLPDLSEQDLPGRDWAVAQPDNDVNSCMQYLRQRRHTAICRLIWWEFGLQGDAQRGWQSISELADSLIEAALHMAIQLIAPRVGQMPSGRFCVIGLGKLGGNELNLGSDIDLLFLWQAEGHSSGGRRSLPAAEYYSQLSRMLIRLLDEPTVNGRVWPTDMRLRPGGASAAIASGLQASIDYYLNYGQTWERAMLLKARPVAGDMETGQCFLQALLPFKFRRYLDYTTVTALADMKKRIDLQQAVAVGRPGYDVKRGRGGIREIEFIVQALQLLNGARITALQSERSTSGALNVLQQANIIPAAQARQLRHSYIFWRRMEHAIQARRGEQTQKLPADYQQWLPELLSSPDIAADMQNHAQAVHSLFQNHVLPQYQQQGGDNWLHADNLPARLSSEQQRHIRQCMQRIRQHLRRGILPERAEAQLERILGELMPRWLDDANGLQALDAFEELVHNIAGRATWIDLLDTHQGTRQWLGGVLSASRYIAWHIARNPCWLEWPLQQERGATEISRLCSKMLALDPQTMPEDALLADIGRCVDQVRLQCALAIDAHEAGPLQIGRWLADIADAATTACIRYNIHRLGLEEDFPLVALAMGKHGSQEMGLASDLDMVFVLVCENEFLPCHGRSLRDQAQRLGRRVIHTLSNAPPFGAGYTFDGRLRPSGNSGVLVTSLAAFVDYQQHHAQTWEHQALCRARTVAGPVAACQQLEMAIGNILAQPRDQQSLRRDIARMREKMLRHLSASNNQIINLKQDRGGLVDIEFLAQFSRLAFGGTQRGTVTILQQPPAKAPGAWHKDAAMLAASYVQYREMENALRSELWQSIAKLPSDPDAPEWVTMQRHCSITTPAALQQRMASVHHCYQRWLYH